MLGHTPFNHNILRKYHVAFGTLFNDVQVVRRDANGAVQQTIDVPLTYSRKEHILARLEADPELRRGTDLPVPMMSYEMTGMDYNAERKLRSTRDYNTVYVNDEYRSILTPVPYDLNFSVYVYAKYQQDGNQILEQILPFFEPHFDVTIDLIEEMGVKVDTPVVFDGLPRAEDNYDTQYLQRRSVVWTLPFTMKAYLFGPVRRHPIIKFVNVNIHDATAHDPIETTRGVTDPVARVTVQPGMDANGNPTDDINVTIPYTEIEKDDDWQYIARVHDPLPPSP